ncbi:MAG: hypothetical protein HUU46_01825 [Candidatus Hydrogenedentes bacterium]|nr:hypothetical protein [Candidatus Hydrogenedentota bacterium]
MNARKAIRNSLLVFAVGSLAYFIVTEVGSHRAATTTAKASAAEITQTTDLVVYYFSEGKECITCEQIPLYARAALDGHFANEMKSGAIVWCAIDVDEPRNRHYIDEYGIYTKCIVLSRIAGGKQTRWKNLDKVWDLVYDKTAFIDYVRNEIRAELDAPA